MLNKKAQVGESISWLVATIVIIIVLTIGVFVANALGTGKGIFGFGKGSYVKTSDRLAETSLNSYLLFRGQDGKAIYDEIKSDGDLNAFNGPKAKNVFENLYLKEGEYREVWFGIVTGKEWNIPKGWTSADAITWNGKSNSYFSGRPKDIASAGLGNVAKSYSLTQTRWFKGDDFMQLFFVGENK